MPAWADAAFDEYARRMPREARVELVEVKPERRSTAAGAQALLAREASRIESALPSACTRIVLDERGSVLTSVQLARALDQWRSRGQDLAFLIGGADGLAASLKSSAAARISRSSFTLPHALARVVLAEQLYRAHSISAGHPYHRAS
jgi:23S rRNA (pseudouridine1915-N3)-methyltransferase